MREAVAPIITPPLPDRQREQCVRQADQAEMLATLVEQSVRMDIWPQEGPDVMLRILTSAPVSAVVETSHHGRGPDRRLAGRLGFADTQKGEGLAPLM